MTALFTSIVSAYTADSDLSSNTNGMGLNKVNPGTSLPYIVFFLVSCVPVYDSNVATPLEEAIIQFNIYSDSVSATEITTLYGYLTTEFDWKTMTVTGYTNVATIRQNSLLLKDDEDRWVYTITYRVILEKM